MPGDLTAAVPGGCERRLQLRRLLETPQGPGQVVAAIGGKPLLKRGSGKALEERYNTIFAYDD